MGKQRHLALFAFLIFLPALFYWFLWQPTGPIWLSQDFAPYLQNAKDIASFNMPSDLGKGPLASLLFALTGVTSENSNSSWLFLVHLLMHGVVVFVVTYILWDLKIPKIAAIGTGILLWLPLYVENAAYLRSEACAEFFLGLMLLGIYQFFKKQDSLPLYIAGICSASIALIRPTFQLLSPFLFLILIVTAWRLPRISLKRRNIVRIGLAFFVPYLLLLGAWSGYNYFHHGFFGIIREHGFYLSTRTAGAIEKLPESTGEVREVLLKYRDKQIIAHHSSHSGYMYIWEAVPELQEVTGKDIAELSRYIFQTNIALIAAAPLHYLFEVGKASVSFWMPAVTGRSFGESRGLQLIYSALGLFVSILFLGLPVIIAVKLAFGEFGNGNSKEKFLARAVFFTTLGIITYNWLISCGYDTGKPRHRSPTDFLIIFAIALVLFSKPGLWRVNKKYAE